MTESQVPIKEFVTSGASKFQELLPGVGKAYEALTSEVYKDGALDSKTKRLMALSVALTHGCRGCILFQTEQALELGASVEEILEACSVAIAVGGTMAGGETARVLQFLTELGRIE
jgi:AhpD family alkylhydroperoxidase